MSPGVSQSGPAGASRAPWAGVCSGPEDAGKRGTRPLLWRLRFWDTQDSSPTTTREPQGRPQEPRLSVQKQQRPGSLVRERFLEEGRH